MIESGPRGDVHYLGSSENKAWKKFRPVRFKLLVGCQLVTIYFLNYLSLVNQVTHEYMRCGRISCFSC